jgi:hypothetical protein
MSLFRVDAQRRADQLGAFMETKQPIMPLPGQLQRVRRHGKATPIIAYFKHHLTRRKMQPDPGVGRAGMPADIAEVYLRHAVHRNFHLGL